MFKSINDILPYVEKPSQYLGGEINSIKKDPKSVDLRIVLAFPDLYEIGTSHFGIQILYNILNQQERIAAERVFAPGRDMAGYLKSSHLPLCSIETHTPLAGFDIIGVSLLYELNYTNVLMILDLAGIPFLAADRDDTHPFIIAGGPCTVNPEPMADFFDAMVIGDGETVILEMARAWRKWKEDSTRDREALLVAWAGIEGVYVPSFFEPNYTPEGFQFVKPLRQGYERVRRAIVADLDKALFPDSPILPFGRPVHDRLRLEITRGCTRGCRFCQAGMIYRPVRERSPGILLELTRRALLATGYEDISLLSLSTGDYACLAPLMESLISRYAEDHIAVSIPSFRAGTLTPGVMGMIRKVRKTGFTIAPEAGTLRLRAVINKNISEKEIFDTISAAFEMGWNLVKLYFMVGLPTETDEDIEGIVDLVMRLRRISGVKARHGKINVSVATFIPKSHVPFQWCSQIDLDTSRDKINYLRRRLKVPGVGFKWQHPETSMMEGIWARGDRRLSSLLVAAYEKGCRFDGWSDSFDFPAWLNAMEATGIDSKFYLRTRSIDEPLPWDHIDTRASKAYLVKEYERSLCGEQTEDCREGECGGCGACDFKTIMPRPANPDLRPAPVRIAEKKQVAWQRVEVTFSRRELARFFGHIEQMNVILRALRRAGVILKFSSGFHPKPKITFEDALPIGVESLCERFYITVAAPVEPARLASGINAELPEGLKISGCRIVSIKEKSHPPDLVTYRVDSIRPVFGEGPVEKFTNTPVFEVKKKTKKGGERVMDLKKRIRHMQRLNDSCLILQIDNSAQGSIRPDMVIRSIFGLSETELNSLRVIKLAGE
ncbi:MAG: TIGR03960 family B12-binding radical SAM protein [Deltaproteobacteria bacterium]|nr:TIGR03960 family B12-binding radical SAM protein [Deltaproteobacteria bacterium]